LPPFTPAVPLANLVTMPKESTKHTKRAAAGDKEEKAKRPPTAYQLYMKDTLVKVKGENPDMTHGDAFKKVAAMWKDADENPNKGKEKPEKKAPRKRKSSDDEDEPPKKKRASKKKKAEEAEESAVSAPEDASE